MNIRVLDSALITDFHDIGFDSAELCSIIKADIEIKIKPFNVEKLNDWNLYFVFRYNHLKQILIYTKEKSNIKEKSKDITIHIPIPTRDKVIWGVEKHQHIYQNESHLDHLLGNFICLSVEISNFNNRRDYILDCMKHAINACFENGFVVNGVKIKV